MKNMMVFFALIGAVGAQVPTGTIAGVVRDPSGAGVAGDSPLNQVSARLRGQWSSRIRSAM